MASLFTGLLGNQGGGTPTCSLTISYTQGDQTTSATENSKQTASVGYTQADQVTSITVNGKQTSAFTYTQADQTVSATLNNKLSSTIGYTQSDQTTSVSATFGAGSYSSAISYTQDSQTTSANVSFNVSGAVSYTQGDQTTAIGVTNLLSVSIGYTQGDQVTSAILYSLVTQEQNSGGYGDYGENLAIHTERKKTLERETKGVIARAKQGDKDAADDAELVIAEIRKEIDRLGIKAEFYERKNKQRLMIEAQLAQEQLEAQIEEIDTAFMMMMLIAQID